MAVLVGIDEAGFGPILGPLVISSSSFSMPRSLLEKDLWNTLKNSISPVRKNLAGRLLIADSKKAYSKALGTHHLQRTVLTCLRCIGREPKTLQQLLQTLCPECCTRISQYPWHERISQQLLTADPAELALSAAMVQRDMKSRNISLLELKTVCLDVAHYNKLILSVDNKARVLFSATAQLIKAAFDRHGRDDLQIIVDRQGGRSHYRRSLQLMFPATELKIIHETDKLSSYEVAGSSRKMGIHFAVAADDRFMPVSLASMVSKYVRELLIENINSYFIGRHADLKPTSGYWTDGLRFIREIKANLPNLPIDEKQLIRSR